MFYGTMYVTDTFNMMMVNPLTKINLSFEKIAVETARAIIVDTINSSNEGTCDGAAWCISDTDVSNNIGLAQLFYGDKEELIKLKQGDEIILAQKIGDTIEWWDVTIL